LLGEQSKPSVEIQLGSWSFNEIKLEDKGMYYNYIRDSECPASSSASNFAFFWGVSNSKGNKTLWKVIDNMLFTFTYTKKGVLYLPFLPFGKGGADKVVRALNEVLKYCYEFNNSDNSNTIVKVINDAQLDFLRKSQDFDKYFKAIPYSGREKHFSIQKLISLSGKEFETIRRKINKFHRLCPNVIIRKYQHSDFEAVMKLAEYWSNTSGKKYPRILDKVYFNEIIRHYDKLDHLILVMEIEGKIVGLVSGGDLPTGQSWWCISKFMNEYEGISETLIIELAKEINRINPKIELMNSGTDGGLVGLRLFKERFRPALDYRRYLVRLR